MPSFSKEEVQEVQEVVSQSDGRRRAMELSREDCLCPVCLDILEEPVTLPCAHTFCKECFLQSVDKATLCCPLCRRRVSTWTRLHSRNNSLVNQQLWTRIQTCFPLRGRGRLAGQEGDRSEESAVSIPRVCQPGEVRQEYEDQINKMTEERRVLDEEQRKASEELIQKLLEEEQLLLQEENRRSEEDQQLALQLSDQLNSAPPPQKKKMHVVGQIDKFLSPRRLTPLSFMSNKENLNRSKPRPLHSPSRTFGVSLKRRSSEEQEEFEESLHDPALPSPSTSSLQEELHHPGQWWQEEEEKEDRPEEDRRRQEEEDRRRQEEEDRRRQEEEDRRLALSLQKELDQEERQKATDRRKGTPSAYQLRRGAQRSRRTPSTSSSPPGKTASSSSCYTHTKQTTLTDIFSSR